MLLLTHFIATAMMTGLIWFVQIVHYPLMAKVGPEHFAEYERLHQQRTTYVVGPTMLVEMITAIALLITPPESVTLLLPGTGFALLVIIWLSTAFLQVPAHRKLEAGFDPATHQRLVQTNWLRTIAWSARTVIAGLLIVHC